jgi:hypothetical protein
LAIPHIRHRRGIIDRDRALRELDAQSDIGRRLMKIELRAIEMVHEDAAFPERNR